jgi:hypothetical protein
MHHAEFGRAALYLAIQMGFLCSAICRIDAETIMWQLLIGGMAAKAVRIRRRLLSSKSQFALTFF